MYVWGMGVHGGAESCQGGLELAHGDPLPACFPWKVKPGEENQGK